MGESSRPCSLARYRTFSVYARISTAIYKSVHGYVLLSRLYLACHYIPSLFDDDRHTKEEALYKSSILKSVLSAAECVVMHGVGGLVVAVLKPLLLNLLLSCKKSAFLLCCSLLLSSRGGEIVILVLLLYLLVLLLFPVWGAELRLKLLMMDDGDSDPDDDQQLDKEFRSSNDFLLIRNTFFVFLSHIQTNIGVQQ